MTFTTSHESPWGDGGLADQIQDTIDLAIAEALELAAADLAERKGSRRSDANWLRRRAEKYREAANRQENR